MNQTANRSEQEDSGQFESFDLTVNLGPDSVPWISATSRVGAVHGIPRHTSTLPALPDLLDMVYDYTDDIQFAELQPNSDMSRILGELVFGDPAVLQLFQATRGVAADRGKQLLFRILASPHLAGLPWELLPDPAVARFDRRPSYLTLASDTHLVRQARGRTYPTRMNMLNAPLNLLLVLSSPTPQNEAEDWLSFDIFEVKQNLLAELAPLEDAGLLCIDVIDRPSIDNLRRRIGAQRRGYHLFHYVGHAFPEGLILEDVAGYRENLSAPHLVELLRLCPDLRLAVFAGCETARSAADPSAVDASAAVGWRDLLSLADYCVQEACPAVIGMQAVLPFSTERVFTRFFYQALATGYSTAESLRLARGAIQADQRVGGELLDWSVPALFVGSGEPGAIVPQTTAGPKAKPRITAKLMLGLRQGNERFFGRDLPLRQAVDVMIGLAPERVLVVTGAAGVGKTSLVDRALEEVRKSISHALFIHFDRIAPNIVRAGALLAAGEMPDAEKLSNLKEDHALEGLCRLTNELLGYNGLQTRDRNDLPVSGWWERIVEDMVQQKFVLVIDEVGGLDRLQRGLLEKLLTQVLKKHVEDRRKVLELGQLREELLEQLSGLQEVLERPKFAVSEVWERIEISEKVLKDLETLPDRLRLEIAQVYGERLEHQVFALNRETQPGEAKDTEQRKSQKVEDLKNLLPALCRIEAVRQSLGWALQVLANRRSQARIVVTAAAPLRDFFNLTSDMVFEMRLAPVTWAETWRWIRRNLPGLVRCGEDDLSRLWGRFGDRLERWEVLERLLLKEQKESIKHKTPWQQGEILMDLAETIISSAPTRATGSTEQLARRGHRALRIAVAGPHLKGPSEIAEAITRLALEHGIGGRVVFDASEAGALATLIDEPSPFSENDTGRVLEIKISQWLSRVIARQPDIILLDYGRPEPLEALDKPMSSERTLFRNINYSTLLIAAGGHEKDKAMVTTPSVYPEVLSVGPLDDNGRLREYAEWHPHLAKPDLFMADSLAATPLGMGLINETLVGSSIAAINAVATAALVWSLIPDLTPSYLGKLLLEAGQPVPGTEAALALRRGSAIALARRCLVQKTLEDGSASLQTLSAITGLEGGVLSALLKRMISDGLVVRLATGRLERFQLTSQ